MPAFDALKGRGDALYVVTDPLVTTNRVRINTLALGARLPTMHGQRENVEVGGLMSNPDLGQNWHCLRPPMPRRTATPSIDVDLPVRERRGQDDVPDHARYRLAPLGGAERAHLVWVFQVPPGIIANHNDIFNSRSASLIMAMIQISGAVMSLAEDWGASFEDYAYQSHGMTGSPGDLQQVT